MKAVQNGGNASCHKVSLELAQHVCEVSTKIVEKRKSKHKSHQIQTVGSLQEDTNDYLWTKSKRKEI